MGPPQEDGPARGSRGASTTEDTSTAAGPTGPGGTGHAAFVRMVGPPGGRVEAPVAAGRRVSHGDGLRGLGVGLIPLTEAQTDRLTVTQDGDATQHQGFRGEQGHRRPPAIVGEETAGPARGRPRWRGLGLQGFSVTSRNGVETLPSTCTYQGIRAL